MLEHYLALPERYYAQDYFYSFPGHFKHIPVKARFLNVGCGRASSLLDYPNAQGIDFNPQLVSLWETQGIGDRCSLVDIADGLPWDAEAFEWTVSVDFLEHLQPEVVEGAVDELLRVASAGRHVIDLLNQSAYRGPNGENLHPSAQTKRFWLDVFLSAGLQESDFSCWQLGRYLYLSYGDTWERGQRLIEEL